MRIYGEPTFWHYNDDASTNKHEEHEIWLPTIGWHSIFVPVLLKFAFATPAKLICTFAAFHMRTSTVLSDHYSAIRARWGCHNLAQVVCKSLPKTNESSFNSDCPCPSGRLLQWVRPFCLTLGTLKRLLALDQICVDIDCDWTCISTVCVRTGAHITRIYQIVLQQQVCKLLIPFF